MTFLRRVKNTFARWRRLPLVYQEMQSLSHEFLFLARRVESIQEALGRIELRQLSKTAGDKLTENEFRVFSQWGEDGIIQFLLGCVEIPNRVFVEFGADNYDLESNTRFLLTNNNWTGLVMDSNEVAIEKLKATRAWVLHNLRAVQAFVTRDNINGLLKENGIEGEIGILSIDIDGNDYWVWQAINIVNPVIVIVEYNHRFGRERAVTIPYDEGFDRFKAHPSRLYFGASLKALCRLGEKKGYAFVGCNNNGVNAFFVRRDKKPQFINEITAEEGYVTGSFSEFFEADGQIQKRSPLEEHEVLKNLGLPLVEVE